MNNFDFITTRLLYPGGEKIFTVTLSLSEEVVPFTDNPQPVILTVDGADPTATEWTEKASWYYNQSYGRIPSTHLPNPQVEVMSDPGTVILWVKVNDSLITIIRLPGNASQAGWAQLMLTRDPSWVTLDNVLTTILENR